MKKLFTALHHSELQCINIFKVPEPPEEVVPIKEILMAGPPEIETPSPKGIIYSIIPPSFI